MSQLSTDSKSLWLSIAIKVDELLLQSKAIIINSLICRQSYAYCDQPAEAVFAMK